MGTALATAPIRQRTERACLALVQAELEVGFSYLRLAEAEFHGGILDHAVGLIGKAQASYAAAMRYLDPLSAEIDPEWSELQRLARELYNAIRQAESFLITAS